MLPKLSQLLGRRTRVILDTNMLMMPGQGVDIFALIDATLQENYDMFVVFSTYYELKQIAEGHKKVKGKEKFNAKLGYIMAHQRNVRQLADKGKNVDDSLVAYANKKTIIVTLDRELQRRVKEKGGRVLTYKQKKMVEE